MDWKFYGRSQLLAELQLMLSRKRWFFAKVTGRRRIGKTTLIRHAIQLLGNGQPVFYLQIPDALPAGLLSAVNDALDMFQVPPDRFPRPQNLLQFARLLEAMASAGYILILDEFQYFNRRGYEEFCSFLQAGVDRLTAAASQVRGGLIVLGSIHTEMMALLEDRTAPLYNRVTDTIHLTHLDIGSLLAILHDHASPDPARLLFLWNLFEGVPKFYRDCFEQNVLAADRITLLRRIFFESSSPLRSEAENWFLRELGGRYDVTLKLVARRPGRIHSELVQAIRNTSGSSDTQVGGYLKVLCEKFGLIERRLPVFSRPDARRGRYYMTDNFLRAWLSALANPVAAMAFRPVPELLAEADRRLAEAEGHALEKLVGQLYEERSRLGISDFPLTSRIQGYWDRTGTEIDLVAINEDTETIRFASCKRAPDKLLADINNFRQHVNRFLQAMPQYQQWNHQLVGISTELTQEHRHVLLAHEVLPQDLSDLTREFLIAT